MTSETNLIQQCLDLTRLLVNSGHGFKINMRAGSFYYFTLSISPQGGENSTVMKKKKRKSPATIRRSRKRREDFVERKRKENTANFDASHLNYTFSDLPLGDIPQVEGNITLEDKRQEEKDSEDRTELAIPSVLFSPSNQSTSSDFSGITYRKAPPIKVSYKCEECFNTFGSASELDVHGKRCGVVEDVQPNPSINVDKFARPSDDDTHWGLFD